MVSRAMRTARRAGSAAHYRATINVPAATFARRLYCDSYGGPVRCYNGPPRMTYLVMIAFYRERYAAGDKAGRIAGAQSFARAARRDGPLPLPDAADFGVAA